MAISFTRKRSIARSYPNCIFITTGRFEVLANLISATECSWTGKHSTTTQADRRKLLYLCSTKGQSATQRRILPWMRSPWCLDKKMSTRGMKFQIARSQAESHWHQVASTRRDPSWISPADHRCIKLQWTEPCSCKETFAWTRAPPTSPHKLMERRQLVWRSSLPKRSRTGGPEQLSIELRWLTPSSVRTTRSRRCCGVFLSVACSGPVP